MPSSDRGYPALHSKKKPVHNHKTLHIYITRLERIFVNIFDTFLYQIRGEITIN